MKESETLMSALEAMQEKNQMLEKSLSAETKIKLDLFSALGETKHQVEIASRKFVLWFIYIVVDDWGYDEAETNFSGFRLTL